MWTCAGGTRIGGDEGSAPGLMAAPAFLARHGDERFVDLGLARMVARRAAGGMVDVGAREGAAKDLPGAP